MNFLHQSTGSTPCSPNTPWAPLPPQHHCTIADSQVCLFHLSFQGPTEGPTLPGSLTKGTLALGSGCFPWGLAALSALLPHSFLNFYSLSWLLFHPPFPSRYCRPLCIWHQDMLFVLLLIRFTESSTLPTELPLPWDQQSGCTLSVLPKMLHKAKADAVSGDHPCCFSLLQLLPLQLSNLHFIYKRKVTELNCDKDWSFMSQEPCRPFM